MKRARPFLLVIAGCMLSGLSFAQEFTSCSAAFVGTRMVVNDYSPTGTCRLSATTTGDLTVSTVDLSPTGGKAVDRIDFKIAIRDKTTNTLRLFSGETFRQVPVQTVLATCKKGDRIVLLTLDNRYALPHNEILVQ